MYKIYKALKTNSKLLMKLLGHTTFSYKLYVDIGEMYGYPDVKCILNI